MRIKRKTGVCHWQIPVFFALLGLCGGGFFAGFSAPVMADAPPLSGQQRPTVVERSEQALQAISDLAKTGAPQLALSLLDRRQPKREVNLGLWMRWERERIYMLQVSQAWGEVDRRVSSLSLSNLPADFSRWLLEQRADALLRLGKGQDARRQWLHLLLSDVDDRAQRQAWRRGILKTYLADADDRDADRAMVRYLQDYSSNGSLGAVGIGDGQKDGLLLRVQVLLRTGRPSLAASLIPEDVKDLDFRLLRWLALWRVGQTSERVIWRQMRPVYKARASLPARQRSALFELRGRLAQSMKDRAAAASAFEAALGSEQLASRQQALRASSSRLWQAYLSLGEHVANQRRLLLGDEVAWYQATDRMFKRYPVSARALLAVLVLKAPSSQQREEAARRLVKSYMATEQGRRLLPRLFRLGERFKTVAQLPFAVRYRLADLALQQGDIEQASHWVEGLARAPAGSDPFDWQLRRARILVLAGRDDQGIAVLNALLKQLGGLSAQQVSRFLQVVFDLQTIERHQAAVRLFERLLSGNLEAKQRREIIFWMAESEEALDHDLRAAQLYLRSAGLLSPFSMDQWAQTARFQAAEVLERIGLLSDARGIYKSLLAVTEDAGRKAVLRQRLQGLILSGNNRGE